ncbi:MAG: NfeD family protein [Hyphomicrobium sp.]|jgi:hypothetical protein
MTSFSEFLASLGLWNWFFAGLLLMLLETLIPGVHFLWFGVAAMVVGALGFGLEGLGFGGYLTLPWQLVLFAGLAVSTVFAVRSMAVSKAGEPSLTVRSGQYTGRIVVVEEAIAGGRGKVRVGDTLWPAQGADAEPGSNVRITGSNDTVLIVEPV